MYGIEDIKKGVTAVVGLGIAFDKSFADGKFQFTDALNFVAPAQNMPTSADALKNIKDQFLDLDSEEREEVIAFVREELDLRNDNLEEQIEDSFDLSLRIYGYVTKYFVKG